jgi:hypothetical protein
VCECVCVCGTEREIKVMNLNCYSLFDRSEKETSEGSSFAAVTASEGYLLT